MTKLEQLHNSMLLFECKNTGSTFLRSIDSRGKIVVTIFYIVTLLTIPLQNIAGIILFALYPIVSAHMLRTTYYSIFKQSTYALPFILFIGIFNPLHHSQTLLYIGSFAISTGWVEFASITLRGLLTMQASIILINATGFMEICRALYAMKLPNLFIEIVIFLYRYLFVIVEEAISRDRARKSRSYGQRNYSPSLWATIVGQLLILSIEKTQHIHQAMEARLYTGKITFRQPLHWDNKDTTFTVSAFSFIIICRLITN
jgi:cobalt/nickel transport system permease protein